MRAGVPIVPVAIVGNEEAMPIIWKSPTLARLIGVPYFPVTANQFVFGPLLGLMVPLPSKFRLRVLPPVTFDVASNQERYNRSIVLEHAEAIRASIQEEVRDMLRHRRSVWFG
jgi:1-acyl-sn-glycerol-3-phosphate acyltransferase